MENLDARNAALDAARAGVSVVPPAMDYSKCPLGNGAKWKTYQTHRASEQQINAWYDEGRTGVGWVCGAVSGGLEVIDFDNRESFERFVERCKEAGVGDLLARIMDGYCEQTPNGMHLPYRCEIISGNQVFAHGIRDDRTKALIETRGEGGYIIVAPTSGSVNMAGNYVLVSGGVKTIANISPEEREFIHDIARSFNETKEEEITSKTTSNGNGDARPGDWYNRNIQWPEILEPLGWKLIYTKDNVGFWRRPGKNVGISGTTNHAGLDLFHCFSSSVPELWGRSHDKFGVYAKMYHGSDLTSAAREIAQKHGSEIYTQTSVDLSGIIGQASQKKKIRAQKEKFPQDLLNAPGIIGDLTRYITETSQMPQPIIALGASIAAVGNVLGRKVMSDQGLRTNIYVATVGETGCGKNYSRVVVSRIFVEVGASSKVIYGQLSSDAAIVSVLGKEKSCLYLWDEFGLSLREILSAKSQSHVSNMPKTLMELYTSAESRYQKKYADSRNDIEIDQPCLSIIGTTVPENLTGSLTSSEVINGFIPRFLFFKSEGRVMSRRRRMEPTPDNIFEWFRHWHQYDPNDGGNLAGVVMNQPSIVATSMGAIAIMSSLADQINAQLIADETISRIYTRTAEIMEKLALIAACADTPAGETPKIQESHAVWARDLALYLSNVCVEDFGRITDSEDESDRQRILELMDKSDDEWVRRSWLIRTARMGSRKFNDQITTLIDMGNIVAKTAEHDGPGRPGIVYRLAGSKIDGVGRVIDLRSTRGNVAQTTHGGQQASMSANS